MNGWCRWGGMWVAGRLRLLAPTRPLPIPPHHVPPCTSSPRPAPLHPAPSLREPTQPRLAPPTLSFCFYQHTIWLDFAFCRRRRPKGEENYAGNKVRGNEGEGRVGDVGGGGADWDPVVVGMGGLPAQAFVFFLGFFRLGPGWRWEE